MLTWLQNRWDSNQQKGQTDEQERVAADVYGFGSISRRQSRKPMVAAVIGGAYGGGMEMLLNCDIVVASEDAKFALPEVKRGVVAIQGGKHISRPTPHSFFSGIIALNVLMMVIGLLRDSTIGSDIGASGTSMFCLSSHQLACANHSFLMIGSLVGL